MSGHCRLMTTALTEQLTDAPPHIVAMLARARVDGSAEAARSTLTALMPEDYEEQAEQELSSLPDMFALSVLHAWIEANNAGIPFEIISEAPEQPIDSARQGRVSVRIDYEETGVRMIVSHVHNRHASWMESKQLASV